MKNDQSVFPDQYDPLIFFSDADLDNFTTYQQYYILYNANQYTQASTLLNNSDVDFYGAWLLNLIENELYAIESNMDTYVPINSKPKLAFHGTNEPTDSEFKTWVYCGIDPGIPEPVVPPAPMPENVLYEDGQFNKALMPSGFTNFDDMLVTYNGGIGTYASRMYSDSVKLLEPYYNTPHIIQFEGTYADSWEYVNGLQRIQTTVPPAGTDETDICNYYSSVLIIPVIIGKGDYTKFCITYELGGTFIGVQFYGKGEEDLLGLYEKNTGSLYYAFKSNGSNITVPQTYTIENDNITYSEGQRSFYAWRYVEIYPKLGWSEVKIKKIWFE